MLVPVKVQTSSLSCADVRRARRFVGPSSREVSTRQGFVFEVARTEQSLQIQEHECFVEVRSRTQRCFCGPVDAAGITEAAPANRRHELAAASPTRRRKLTVAVSSRSCQLRSQHKLCLKCRQAAVIQRPLMTGRAFGAFQPQSKVDSMRALQTSAHSAALPMNSGCFPL